MLTNTNIIFLKKKKKQILGSTPGPLNQNGGGVDIGWGAYSVPSTVLGTCIIWGTIIIAIIILFNSFSQLSSQVFVPFYR